MLEGLAYIYETFFSALGLASPWKRLFFGCIVGFGGQFMLKPSISYNKNGTAKQFPSETLLPWYALSVVPGIIFALFL